MPDHLSHDDKVLTIGNLCHTILENYPFEDAAEKMVSLLEGNLESGAYNDKESFGDFAIALTNDLRTSSGDRHIHIFYHPAEAERLADQPSMEDDYPVSWWHLSKSDNFGIQKLAYLLGNIGYIKINVFAPVIYAGSTVISSMQFLSEADAIIFDLRECRGGDPFTVQLFESYLFSDGKNPKLFLTKYSKVEYPVQQTWSLPFVPGKRLPDVPVYVLTSGDTFSGGEDMAYTLKHHQRARIVGENTAGGAHPIEQFSIGSGFIVIMPNAYPEHPVTKSNWEGKGVSPDISAAREAALPIAHEAALKQLLEQAKDSDQTHRLQWCLDRVKAVYHPVEVPKKTLANYTGVYRGWEVKLLDDDLYLSEVNGIGTNKLMAITQNTFIADQDYNLRFEIGEDGKARALTWLPKENKKELEYQKD